MHHGKASPHVCMHAIPCRQAVEAQMYSDFLVGGAGGGRACVNIRSSVVNSGLPETAFHARVAGQE